MTNVCEDCVMRLFNTKHYNLQGIGNPYFGKCIVIPNVDYVAYKKGDIEFSKYVEIIKSIISSTGELSDIFIVPYIRCNETISCKLTDEVYNRCLINFSNDIIKYDFQDILLLGEAGRRFFSCDINDYLDTIIVSSNNRRYCVNYSPLIKYFDDNKFEVFKSHLLKWYNSVNNKIYNGYEVLKV